MVKQKETNPDSTMSSEAELSATEMHVAHDSHYHVSCVLHAHYQYQDYHLKTKITDQEHTQT